MASFFPDTYVYDFLSEPMVVVKSAIGQSGATNDDFEYISNVPKQRWWIRLALKYRDFILRTPILRSIAHKLKPKYYQRGVPNLTVVFNAGLYMGHSCADFIRLIYTKMLGRVPDAVGFDAKMRFYQRGGSKEAIVWSIYTSAEFNHRFEIKNAKMYKKAYNKYRLIMLARRLPFASAYVRAKALDRVIVDIQQFVLERNTKLDGAATNIAQLRSSMDEVATNIAQLRSSVDGGGGLAAFKSKTDKLYGTFEPYLSVIQAPVPETLRTEGNLGVRSYLDEARKGMTEEEKQLVEQYSEEDKFYYYMAKLFRGSEEFLYRHFDSYIDSVIEAFDDTNAKPILDIGCGKGDWLRYLRRHGIKAQGIDVNQASASEAIKGEFEITIADGVEYLKGAKNSDFSAITLLAVAEHMTAQNLDALMREIARVLAPGGVFIMETNNPHCFFHYGGFYTDPSHILWVSPDATKLKLEMWGFNDVNFVYYAPYEWLDKSPTQVKNYQGYAIIARKGKP
ncbi:MAG: class I SAM-dependent methyltransferase [Clostridiales bacterium]|jgi:O-antigen chain-terminating methyltransferase|nr:class I SAM-dependent methyltransferase [Clostridiales bacterium]